MLLELMSSNFMFFQGGDKQRVFRTVGAQEMLEKGGAEGMMKNGAKLLMTVALSKITTPEEPLQAPAAAVQPTTPVPDVESGLREEYLELQREQERKGELNAELRSQVATWHVKVKKR